MHLQYIFKYKQDYFKGSQMGSRANQDSIEI